MALTEKETAMNVIARNSVGDEVVRPIAPQPIGAVVTSELERRFLTEPRAFNDRYVQHWQQVDGGLRVKEVIDGEEKRELFYRDLGDGRYMNSDMPLSWDGPSAIVIQLV
jgi:hypothetical protein